MKAKHTPGRWYVQSMPDDPNYFWVKSDQNDVVTYGTDILCDDFGDHVGYPLEQRRADAHLVSAAPELLDACEATVKCARGVHLPVEVVIKLVEAIAKAKNE